MGIHGINNLLMNEQYGISRPYNDILPKDVWNVEYLGEGAHSYAYSFTDTQGDKVLRINPETDYGFLKDRYAATYFSWDSRLPIPAITDIDYSENDNAYYATSYRAYGRDVYHLPDDEKPSAESLLPMLDALSQARIAEPGYGWWDGTGRGMHGNWQQTIEEFRAIPNKPDVDWMRNGDDKELFDAIDVAIGRLIPGCPNERQLVHGDIASNTLVDQGRVTGVIDWSHAMYGDALFNVAQLDLHNRAMGYADTIKRLYTEEDRLPENYYARIACYKLLIAISDLSHYARHGMNEQYARAKSAAEEILAAG